MKELVILIQIIFSVIDSKARMFGQNLIKEKLCIQGQYYDIVTKLEKLYKKNELYFEEKILKLKIQKGF